MAEKGGSPFKDKGNGLGQEFKMSKHKSVKGQGSLNHAGVSFDGFAAALGSFEPIKWDPLSSADWDEEPPSSQCLLRIKRFEPRIGTKIRSESTDCLSFYRDIMSIYQAPPPGMFIYPDEKVLTKVSKVITNLLNFGIFNLV